MLGLPWRASLVLWTGLLLPNTASARSCLGQHVSRQVVLGLVMNSPAVALGGCFHFFWSSAEHQQAAHWTGWRSFRASYLRHVCCASGCMQLIACVIVCDI